MSSRIRSDWGSLGARGTSGHTERVPLPCHVWVTLPGDTDWRPGLLVRWQAADGGGWAGEVAILGDSGAAGLQLVAAERLRPAHTTPPLPWA